MQTPSNIPTLEGLQAENAALRAQLKEVEAARMAAARATEKPCEADHRNDSFPTAPAHVLRKEPVERETLIAAVVEPAQPQPQPRHPVDPSPGCHILIVDDNRDAANSLGNLFDRQGKQVEIAFDGPSALERFEARQPGLIILDIGMPGMDGYEVARRIRARTERMRPTLVAMSGLGQEADRQRSRAAGFDYHLVKPIPINVLVSLLSAGRGLGQSGRITLGVADAAPVGQIDCPPVSPRELLHDLAQPLNTIACYAVAARNLVAKSSVDRISLCNALRGIDQQIQRAGSALDRLRALFHDAEFHDAQFPDARFPDARFHDAQVADPEGSRPPGKGSGQD